MSDVNSVNVDTPSSGGQKTNAGEELRRQYPLGTLVAVIVTLRCGGGAASRDVSGVHTYDDWCKFVKDVCASRPTVFAVTNAQGELLGEERIRDASIVVNVSSRFLSSSDLGEQENGGNSERDVMNDEQAGHAEPGESDVDTVSDVSEAELPLSDARLDAPLPAYQAEPPGRKGWSRVNPMWSEGGRMLAARLTSYGALLFSPATLDQFGLTSATRCRLHFDLSQNKLGVELLSGETGEAARRDGTLKIHTTPGSAYVMVTSVLRNHRITTAADSFCPVVAVQNGGKNLISVDLEPAIRAAKRGGVTMPHRPGASVARRRKPSRQELGELVNSVSECVHRVVAKDSIYQHKGNDPQDRALGFLSDMPWEERRFRERTLADLVKACAPDPQRSDAAVRLAQGVAEGHLSAEKAWHALSLVVGRFPPDLIIAHLGGPKPAWLTERLAARQTQE